MGKPCNRRTGSILRRTQASLDSTSSFYARTASLSFCLISSVSQPFVSPLIYSFSSHLSTKLSRELFRPPPPIHGHARTLLPLASDPWRSSSQDAYRLASDRPKTKHCFQAPLVSGVDVRDSPGSRARATSSHRVRRVSDDPSHCSACWNHASFLLEPAPRGAATDRTAAPALAGSSLALAGCSLAPCRLQLLHKPVLTPASSIAMC